MTMTKVETWKQMHTINECRFSWHLWLEPQYCNMFQHMFDSTDVSTPATSKLFQQLCAKIWKRLHQPNFQGSSSHEPHVFIESCFNSFKWLSTHIFPLPAQGKLSHVKASGTPDAVEFIHHHKMRGYFAATPQQSGRTFTVNDQRLSIDEVPQNWLHLTWNVLFL